MSIRDRGFASMDKTRQREIARRGGSIAHERGVARVWTPEEAREAGRKGVRRRAELQRALIASGDRCMSTRDRGFASMNKNRQREIARLGGLVAHKTGVAHVWTPEEAREAGLKGARSRAAKTLRLTQ